MDQFLKKSIKGVGLTDSVLVTLAVCNRNCVSVALLKAEFGRMYVAGARGHFNDSDIHPSFAKEVLTEGKVSAGDRNNRALSSLPH